MYNHTKVKAHVTFTKGEGFGRPLLEACMSGKPIIATGWSGHLDFLNPDQAVLVAGELKPVHPSSVWENVIMKEAQWFAPDINHGANALAAVFASYPEFKTRANALTKQNRELFSYRKIRQDLWTLLTKYLPEFTPDPIIVPIALPALTAASIVRTLELPED